MDEETREALTMTAEDLHALAIQGQAVPVAKSPLGRLRITQASTQIMITTTRSTSERIYSDLRPAHALPIHIPASR